MVSMDLSTGESDGQAVVALRGELDVADAASVAAALVAVAARAPEIIVDLAGLEFIDSSGVAALVLVPGAPGGRRCRWRSGGSARSAGRAPPCGQERARGRPPAPRAEGKERHDPTAAWQGKCPRDRLASLPPACSAAEPEQAAGSRPLAGRMTGSRPARIWGLVAAQAADRGGRVSAADACTAAVAAVGVTGAWLSVADGADTGHLMRVTDAVGEQLAELQLTLGEGPSLDASASGGPVLASDLGAAETAGRWPAFAPAALRAGAAAIFMFPLRIGAIRAGPGPAPGRDRPGHRDAHRAARDRHRGRVRAVARLCLCQ